MGPGGIWEEGVDMIKICCISIRNAQRINTNIILKKTKLKYDKCGENIK